MDVLQSARELSEKIMEWYRELHQFPELGLHCPQTAAYIGHQLEEMGIPYQTYQSHSGITALIGKPGGRVAAIRADMDGLAVEEKNSFPYASKNGNMHACGHDAHVAIALGCAALLKKMEGELQGQVKIIFQPAEEPLEGAKAMIADGVLENPRPDRLFILHVGGLTSRHLPVGSVVVPKKYAFASSDVMRLQVLGKGGHAATPQLVQDPIVAAARVVENLQTIVSREIKPDNPAVVSVTSLQAGNGSLNIIPNSAELIVGFRALDSQTREFLRTRIAQILHHTTAVSGLGSEAETLVGCAPALNDPGCAEEFMASAQKVLPRDQVHWLEELNLGGEDAAYMMEQIPSVYYFLQNSIAAEDGVIYPHHNPQFRLDETVLYYGAALHLQAILDYFAS